MSAIHVLTCYLSLLVVAMSATARDCQKAPGNPKRGKLVFELCRACHKANTDGKKAAPALKGLFKKPRMTNGKKPTEENVRTLISEGVNGMPAYKDLLNEKEKRDLMAYLRTQ